MFTLIHTTKAHLAALFVEVESESEKAIKFKVVDCPKVSLWFPKKALKVNRDDDGDIESYELAFWFKLESFALGIFGNYANHYKI